MPRQDAVPAGALFSLLKTAAYAHADQYANSCQARRRIPTVSGFASNRREAMRVRALLFVVSSCLPFHSKKPETLPSPVSLQTAAKRCRCGHCHLSGPLAYPFIARNRRPSVSGFASNRREAMWVRALPFIFSSCLPFHSKKPEILRLRFRFKPLRSDAGAGTAIYLLLLLTLS